MKWGLALAFLLLLEGCVTPPSPAYRNYGDGYESDYREVLRNDWTYVYRYPSDPVGVWYDPQGRTWKKVNGVWVQQNVDVWLKSLYD